MAEDYAKKLQSLLRKLFQFESADLDFGIYRIMNKKRDVINRFIEKDLIAAVDAEFGKVSMADKAQLLAEVESLASKLGIGVDDDPVALRAMAKKVPALQPLITEFEQKRTDLLNLAGRDEQKAEVFNHIYQFFSRYYDNGDFMSMRRYSAKQKFAVPYNGEEVLLHWANKDQYYIKTGEYFFNYAFRVGDYTVRFQIVQAEYSVNNTKSESRFFVLKSGEGNISYYARAKQLVVLFEYRALTKSEEESLGSKNRQEALNEQATAAILAAVPDAGLKAGLTREAEGKIPLAKNLATYAKRNTTDYFIHKDLAGFLTQELDFYIKNEMFDLDDLGSEKEVPIEQYLNRVRVMKAISLKIIAFLAQIEDFQKKLFEKKKFVMTSEYCMTLDHVPEEFYPEIVKNAAQIAEWKVLYGIGETNGQSTFSGSKGNVIDEEFLKSHPYLVLDTKFFPPEFKDRLLSIFDDLDDAIGGLMVKSENWQALNLLQERYRKQVKCIYIDPPYNRGNDEFLYKDNYKHSSWLSMMYDRIALSARMLHEKGVLFSSIDENERDSLQAGLDLIFGRDNRVEELIWAQNTTHSQVPLYSTNHEYIEVYARNLIISGRDPTMFREPKPGYFEIASLIAELNPSYPKISEVENSIVGFYKTHIEEYKAELQEMGLEYNEETKKQDPWRGIYSYSHAEYRDTNGNLIHESKAKENNAQIWIWQEDNSSAPAQKQADSIRDPNDPNYRFYQPLHPVTKKPCPSPKTGWRWPKSWPDNSRDSFESLDRANRIAWGDDESKVPRYKRFLHEVETNVAKSVFHDYSDGEKQISALFGAAAFFSTTKPTSLPARFIIQTCNKSDLILDYFVGSGTSGHAVIDLNREDNGNRKYLLIEMAGYFNTILKPRIQKVVYSSKWKDGKPQNTDGISHIFKYLTLEQYEDTLNNIEFQEAGTVQKTLMDMDGYFLRYMLDFETRESPCRMNVTKLERPFEYTLRITRDNELRNETVDLVETFNYLLGLMVKRIRTFTENGTTYRVVHGETLTSQPTTVVWRTTVGLDLKKDKAFIEETVLKDPKFKAERVFINSDFHVEGALSIEPEFQRFMGA